MIIKIATLLFASVILGASLVLIREGLQRPRSGFRVRDYFFKVVPSEEKSGSHLLLEATIGVVAALVLAAIALFWMD